MTDDTQILTKTPEEPQQSETKDVDESYFIRHNLSGRFWIALLLVFGLVVTTILILHGDVKLEGNAAIAVYTSFSSGALSIIGIYMGQQSKPKAQQ